MKKGFILFYSILLCAVLNAQTVVPTLGKEFWLGFMHNFTVAADDELRLFITADEATTGTVSVPLQGWSANFNVIPNVTTTVIIPNPIAEHFNSELIEGKGVHVEALDTIGLFAINFESHTADGFKVLPINSLGTNYLLSAYIGLLSYPSEFLIVATEDDTEVEITPSAMTENGQPAGVPYIVNLMQGESYQVKASSSADDFTGTWVIGTVNNGDCRPFAVFSGAQCTNIPAGCTACDHIVDQDYAVETWGNEYHVTPFIPASSYTFRVLALEDNTTVFQDGALLGVINSGQFLEFNDVSAALFITADKPINTIQYHEGITCSGAGDPAMLNLNSSNLKINNITFSTVESTVITQHDVNIITTTADVAAVLLDGVAVGAGNFTQFPGDPTHSYAQISLVEGSHTLASPEGLIAYAYGTGGAESYAYSLGSFSEEDVVPFFTTFCTGDSVLLQSPEVLFDAWWAIDTAPLDTIGLGDQYIVVPPITNNIYILTGNSLVSGCEKVYEYSVESPDSIFTDITEPNVTICTYEDVPFSAVTTPPGTYFYHWYPEFLFDDPALANPIANFVQDTWIYVDVQTLTGCSFTTDSAYITLQSGNVLQFDASTDLSFVCYPDSTEVHVAVSYSFETDDFNTGTNIFMWNNISNGIPSAICGAVSGDALYFDGNGVRSATTFDFDFTGGGVISFALQIADGVAPCDDADLGEDVVLEYSTDGGLFWNNITTYFEYDATALQIYEVALPLGAQTASTRLRWRQLANSGIGQDNWILDNINLSSPMANPMVITWTSTEPITNPNNTDTYVTPMNSTYFYVNATDNLCEYSDSVLVNVETGFTLNASPDTALCSQGNLQLEVITSALFPLEYTWSPGNILDDSTITNPIATMAGDAVFVVDAISTAGCTASDSITVSVINAFELDAIADDENLCLGGNTGLEAFFIGASVADDFNNGIDFNQWENVVGGAPGIDCGSVTGNALYFNGGVLRWAETIDINTSSGGTVDFWLKIGNGFFPCEDADIGEDVVLEYSTNGGGFWTNMGFYDQALYPNFIFVSQAIPLAAQTPATRFRWSQPVFSGAGSDNWALDDVEISVSSTTSGFDFTWSPTATLTNFNTQTPTAFPLTNTTYYLTVSDSVSNCLFTDSVLINVFDLQVTPSADTASCGTIGIQLNVDIVNGNAPVIVWSPDFLLDNPFIANPTILDDITQTFYVTVEDPGICTITDSVVVTLLDPAPYTLQGDSTICLGDQFQMGFNGVYESFTWGPPAVFDDPIAPNPITTITSPTVVTLTAIDFDGCVLDTTINFDINDVPMFNLGLDTSICQGDNIVLDPALNDVTYIWSDFSGNPTFTISSAGIYWLNAINICGNTIDSLVLSVNTLPAFDLGADTSICNGETVTLDPGIPGTLYQWSNFQATPTITVGNGGNYSLTLTDANQCMYTDDIDLSIYALPVINLGPDQHICQYDFTNLLAEGYTSVLWSDMSTSSNLFIDAPGTYWVEVSDDNNCSNTDEIEIIYHDLPDVNLGDDFELCYGPSIPISSTGLYEEYLWSNAQSTPSIVINSTGTYWLEVTDIWDCVNSDTLTVVFHPNPLANFSLNPVETTFLNTQVAFYNESLGAVEYNWDFGDNEVSDLKDPVHTFPFEPGDYKICLEAYSDFGCLDTVCKIFVIGEEALLYVPSSFSPDGDGINDQWTPVLNFEPVGFELTVYDRWGHAVWQTLTPGESWNGAGVKNEEYFTQQQVYVYHIKVYTDNFEDKIEYFGHLTLIR